MRVAEALLEHEVLDGEQMKQVIEGRTARDPQAGAGGPAAAAARARCESTAARRAGGILSPPMAAPKPTS